MMYRMQRRDRDEEERVAARAATLQEPQGGGGSTADFFQVVTSLGEDGCSIICGTLKIQKDNLS